MGRTPAWLRDFRELLERFGSGWLILTESGPQPRARLNGNPEGHTPIGWYTRRVSDEQLLEDVAHARADAPYRSRGFVRTGER